MVVFCLAPDHRYFPMCNHIVTGNIALVIPQFLCLAEEFKQDTKIIVKVTVNSQQTEGGLSQGRE
jgi:hypothetical protein